MVNIITLILVPTIILTLQFWAESRIDTSNNGRKKFGDGNDRYDFSDYVNEKADKDPMNKNKKEW